MLNILDNGLPPLSTDPEIDIIIVGTNDTPYVVSGDLQFDLYEDDVAIGYDNSMAYHDGDVSPSVAVEDHGLIDDVYTEYSDHQLDYSDYLYADLYAVGDIGFSDFDSSDEHTVSVVSVDITSNSLQAPSLSLMDALRDIGNTFYVDYALQDNQFNWSFILPNRLVHYLGDYETLDVAYTIAISDDSLTTEAGEFSEVDTTFFDVSISIHGQDDQLQLEPILPIVISELDQSSERSEAGLTGLLDVVDPDGNPLTFGIYGVDHDNQESLIQSGLYGDLHLEPDTGAYRYEYDVDFVESLDTDDHLYEEFHITVSNGANQITTDLLTIDIYGEDDAPELGVIESGLIAEMSESSEVTKSALSGLLDAFDFDDDTMIYGIHDGVVDHSASVSTKMGDYGLMSVNLLNGEYSYTPDLLLVEALGANEIVSDEFTLFVNDGDGMDVTETFFVHLVGAADAPTISAPDQLVTDEDVGLLFSEASNHFLIDDIDGNLSSLSLEVSFGQFILETTADVDIQLSEDESFIQLSGNQSDLNSALRDLIYTPHHDFNGEDSLIVAAYDSSPSPLSTVLTVPLTVTPVNDPPSSQSASVSLNEDQPYVFDLFDFFFEDIDDGDYLSGIEITALPHTGTLLLDNVPISSDDFPDPLVISASDISNLSFMPQPDEAYMNYDSISFKVLDQGGLSSSKESITLNVNPVADLIDIVASDNIINQAEKAVGVTLSGTAEGADFVFVEWGGVEKVATVQDGLWSVLFPTIVNVVFDLGDFQSASFEEVSLADIFEQIPQLTFEDVMSFNVLSTEVPDDEIDSTISTVAMSSSGEMIGSQVRFVTIDTTPPPTPKLASLAGNSEINYVESRDRIFIEGYSEPLNTVQLKWDRTTHTTSSDEEGYWSTSIRSRLFEEGLHQIMFITSTDPAGNESGPSVDLYGVDTKRPSWPTINDITSDNIINIAEVESGIYLNGNAEGDSRIDIDWNGSTFTTYADVLDRWEIFISSDEFYASVDGDDSYLDSVDAEISHSDSIAQNTILDGDLSIASIDLFGNVSSTRTITPVFDLVAPDQPILPIEYSDLIVLNETSRLSGFSLEGHSEPLGQVFIRLGFSTWFVDVEQDGSWYFDLPTSAIPLDSSNYQFEFTAIDKTGNTSNILSVPVIVDSKPPSRLTVDGDLFGDNAISPEDLVDSLVISGSTDLDASSVEINLFDSVYSTVPDGDGLWSFALDPSIVPLESSNSELIVTASDDYQNILTQVHDFVVAVYQPESPTINPISKDGLLNDSDSRLDVTIDGTAPIDHHVVIDYRDRSYDVDVDEHGQWSLSLPFPSNGIYPISAKSYFDPSHESLPVSAQFVVDTKPPRAIDGELSLLDDALIQLRFDEDLRPGSITHSSLDVLVDQKPVDVSSAVISPEQPDLLTISLNIDPASSQEISITYRPRSSDSFVVQDVAGNVIEPFFNFSVNHLVTQNDVPSLASDFKSVLTYGDNPVNIKGNHANNLITANSANNVIEGYPGADVLTGGSGADRFVYRQALDSFLGDSVPYYDHITDFNPSTDMLQLPFGSFDNVKELPPISDLTSSSLSDAFASSAVDALDILTFEVEDRFFVLANDQNPSYSADDDILIEVTGIADGQFDSTNIDVIA